MDAKRLVLAGRTALTPASGVYHPPRQHLFTSSCRGCVQRAGALAAPQPQHIGITLTQKRDSLHRNRDHPYMEGNRLGASNLQLYEERIKQAAGRMFTAYPTVARLWLPRVELEANLIEVGRISREYEIQFSRPGLALAYGATPGAVLNTEDGRQFVKTLSGHWYDGFDFKSHFDEPEGTFSVKERQPATT